MYDWRGFDYYAIMQINFLDLFISLAETDK